MNRLTVKQVNALNVPGRYCDGGSLYLAVGEGNAKSWVVRTLVQGRRTEIGLGSAHLITLAEAREASREILRRARAGLDPVAERKQKREDQKRQRDEEKAKALTLGTAATTVHANLGGQWRSEHYRKVWLSVVRRVVPDKYWDKPIATFTAQDMVDLLSPVAKTKPETARRVKQRLAMIFDWAKSKGHYTGDNPVKVLTAASLPTAKKEKRHRAAMAWKDVPDFMDDLAGREGVSARCLEFLILTAARSGEARGTRWAEINFAEKVWTVPAERMKAGKEHRVPLSPQALAVLHRVRGLDSDLVFPSAQREKSGAAKVQSDMVFAKLYERMKRSGFTTHGFRSTFRDWCAESARADREVAEMCLAHVFGNAVERAYARSDLFERRCELMGQWSEYVIPQETE